MDYLKGEDHTIEKPTDYSFWRDYVPKLTPSWTGSLLNWSMCDPKTLGKRDAYFDPNPDAPQRPGLNLWTYRRIADQSNFLPGTYRSSITLVNWPQNDYWLVDLVTASAGESKDYLRKAKQLSLSLLYWMQTDAPRPDGGTGWKGLRLRKDVVDTEDGLAKAPYIRESRRIKAEFTILEQHVGTEMRRKEREYRSKISGRLASLIRSGSAAIGSICIHRPDELHRHQLASLSDSARCFDSRAC